MPQSNSIQARSARRLAVELIFLAALLFLPAGSLHFWQGWMFLALTASFWIFFLLNFLKRDPQLLARRLQHRETEPQQRLFQGFFLVLIFSGFILAGLDFRFGWSRHLLSAVPLAVVLAAQIAVVAAYWIVFRVMEINTFAASTIQVEKEQRVISSGPYAWVRHPMYTGMALTAVAIPLALGSYVAWPVFALMIPVLAYRLIHEERTLRRDLPGYADYCARTRFRLIPGIW